MTGAVAHNKYYDYFPDELATHQGNNTSCQRDSTDIFGPAPFDAPDLSEPDRNRFQPDSRFALIFRELWNNHKVALIGGALMIVAAALVNAFVGVITVGTLSIPAATLSASTFSSGWTCTWIAFLRACVEANKEYGYQQLYIKDLRTEGTVAGYQAHRLRCKMEELTSNNK